MRKHECLESTEDYVRYLERRVELLELRVKKCRMDSDLFDSHSSVNERSNAFEMATLRKARSGLPVNYPHRPGREIKIMTVEASDKKGIV